MDCWEETKNKRIYVFSLGGFPTYKSITILKYILTMKNARKLNSLPKFVEFNV